MAGESPESFLDVAPPEGWGCRSLEDLVERDRDISYGIVQPGSHDASGVPIVRVNNLRHGRIETDDVLRVSHSVEAKYARTRLRGGEVLLSLVGTLGECAVVPHKLAGWNVARAVAVIPLKAEFNPRWIATCLRSQQLQHLIHTWATTTVQATLNLRDVRRLPVVLPPTETTAWMMDVIGSLDDKIELNRRTNQALEAIARAIFQAWFIEFEPVKARTADATRFPDMPQEIFDQLPDQLTETELGPIPEGWEVVPLSDLVELIGGGTPKRKVAEYWDGSIPWFSIRDAPSEHDVWVIETEERITEAGVENSSAKVMREGTTIISARGTVGRLALTAVPMAMNQSCYGVQGVEGVGDLFVYFTIHHAVVELQQRTHGSVFDTITRKTFDALSRVRPQPDILEAFEDAVTPLLHLIRNNLFENRALAHIRDTLLPKLILDQISVSGDEGVNHGG